MEELVNNLKHCLDFFELPEVESEENTQNFVRSAIVNWKLKTHRKGHMDIKSLDVRYLLCDEKDMQAIIDWDWTDNKKYVSEKYDCDNFAFSFKAMVDRRFGLNNVGLVIDLSGKHAYNIIVFKDGSVKLFEPQSDRWPTVGTGMHKFEKGFILI